MFETYQHLPEHIDPIALSIGPFSLHWYAVLYLLAFGVSFVLFRRSARNGSLVLSTDQCADLLLFGLAGALLGSRLGYAVFYNPSFYAAHPLAIVSPIDSVTGMWVGISGMSYYGGLVGVVAALAFFARRNGVGFWEVADRVAMAVPAGYFLGRVGNFANGELFGRATSGWWGMHFPSDDTGGMVLRHPSQLYEAFLEGIVLFIFLKWVYPFGRDFSGRMASVYVMSYACIRFIIEFAREPDPQLGILAGGLTLGQYLSLVAFVSGGIIFLWLRRRGCAKM